MLATRDNVSMPIDEIGIDVVTANAVPVCPYMVALLKPATKVYRCQHRVS